MIKKILNEFQCMGKAPLIYFKLGCSVIIAALCGVYFLCERDVTKGSVGIALCYAPMLDYILTALVIVWAGMLLIDLLQKDIRRK